MNQGGVVMPGHTAVGRPKKTEDGSGFDSRRLFRISHIFASTVREILAQNLLQEACSHSLTPSQLHLLKLMSIDGEPQIGQLAGFLGVSPPAATKNVDKLERLGLVARVPSKGDRRTTLLSVNAKGRRVVEKYETLTTNRLSSVLDGFKPGEIEQLSELLERFSVMLLGMGPGSGRSCLRCGSYYQAGCPVGEARGGCPYDRFRKTRPTQGRSTETS
jgi:DNA-binding MarR family transcriptional regulator